MPGSRLEQKVEGGLKIGIVGFGEAGVELTTQLIDKHSKAISKIYVNRRNQQAAETLIDCVVGEHIRNHPEKKRLQKLVELVDYRTIADNADITFFTYGETGLDPQDRCEPFNVNIESFYAPVGGDPKNSIAECFKNYKGLVVVYTNPPDYLCYFFMKELNLESNQIIGFCPDTNRLADRCKPELKKDFVTPEISELLRDKTQEERNAIIEAEIERAASTIMWLGPHGGDERVPVFSPVTVWGSSKKDLLKARSATMFGEIKGRIYDIISELGMTTREVVPYIVNSMIPAMIDAKSETEIDPCDDAGCKMQKFFVMSAYHKLTDGKDLFYGLPIVFYKEERKENGKKKSRIRVKIVKLYRGKDGLFNLDRLDRDEQEKVNEGMRKVRNTLEEAIKIGKDYGLGVPKLREKCVIVRFVMSSKLLAVGRKTVDLCPSNKNTIYGVFPFQDYLVLHTTPKSFDKELLEKINYFYDRLVDQKQINCTSATAFDGKYVYVALENGKLSIIDAKTFEEKSIAVPFRIHSIIAHEQIYFGSDGRVLGFAKRPLLEGCLERILEVSTEGEVVNIKGAPESPFLAVIDKTYKGAKLRVFDASNTRLVYTSPASIRDIGFKCEQNKAFIYFARGKNLVELACDEHKITETEKQRGQEIDCLAVFKNVLYIASGCLVDEISLANMREKRHTLDTCLKIRELIPAEIIIK